jgi:hypothetical protein
MFVIKSVHLGRNLPALLVYLDVSHDPVIAPSETQTLEGCEEFERFLVGEASSSLQETPRGLARSSLTSSTLDTIKVRSRR